jgi:UDP-N-acetylglucosamine 4,6-dehydratase/5-epimerase
VDSLEKNSVTSHLFASFFWSRKTKKTTIQNSLEANEMLNGATILVTGGTGSFGQKFVKMTLDKYSPRKIIIYSRDEMKQWEMAAKFKNDEKLRFFIGDVRDKERLSRACSKVDYIVHAAALKIIPTAEYNPFECIKTNINGAMNVIECALDNEVKRVVALSTDKACNPINLYGATKLCSDKLFVSGNSYSGDKGTRFSVVRYGNVMGSRGSVIPFFRSIRKTEELPITDERMTRFMISLEQGVELVLLALQDCVGGEIYVRKIPSMKVIDIAKTINPHAKIKLIGIRPGEKLHEQMISVEDAIYTREYSTYYKILPQIHFWSEDPARIKDGKSCAEGFSYSSDKNSEWMKPDELNAWIKNEYEAS